MWVKHFSLREGRGRTKERLCLWDIMGYCGVSVTRAEAAREKVSENFQSFTLLHFLLEDKRQSGCKRGYICISIFLAFVPFFPGNLECLCLKEKEKKRGSSILGLNYSHPVNSSMFIVKTACFFPVFKSKPNVEFQIFEVRCGRAKCRA